MQRSVASAVSLVSLQMAYNCLRKNAFFLDLVRKSLS